MSERVRPGPTPPPDTLPDLPPAAPHSRRHLAVRLGAGDGTEMEEAQGQCCLTMVQASQCFRYAVHRLPHPVVPQAALYFRM